MDILFNNRDGLKTKWRRNARRLSAAFLAVAPLTAIALPLSLSQIPLFVGGAVDTNIVLTLDDSGSMHWEYMPDDNWTYFAYPRASNVYSTSNYGNFVPEFSSTLSYSVRVRSPYANKMYYNPEVTYSPWKNHDNSSFPQASITCAYHNPFKTSVGCRDLTNNNTQSATWETYNGGAAGFPGGVTSSGGNRTFWPAQYFRYNSGDEWNAASYTQVLITPSVTSYTGGPNRSDCGDTPAQSATCTYAQEIQNFANWYTYYRSRILTARAGIGTAFADQGTNMRVGFGAINVAPVSIDGWTSDGTMVRGVREFSGTDRQQFFTDLYGHNIPTSGTPLRTALQEVGEYYSRTDNRGPWGKTPGSNDGTAHLECRQSYNILMTDGYYNGANPGVGNVDNNTGPTITGPDDPDFTYNPADPYNDSYSNTLADTAMEYWVNDLRGDLANRVKPNNQDPAFWQHMVNFTVGLGVIGTLDPDTDLPDIESNVKNWPDPQAGNPQRIDDMWHAALNSRGNFYSANDPVEFKRAFEQIFTYLGDLDGSAASVALNTGSIASDSKVYQAKFDGDGWFGRLLAYQIQADGSLASTETWDARDHIPAPSSRVIVTSDGVNGQAFRWSSGISAAQQTLLGSSDVLDYLRGDQTNEQQGSGTQLYRNRQYLLGDLVHSAPSFVGVTNFFYPDDWGASGNNEPEDSSPYSSYVASLQTMNSGAGRDPIVYIGGNDGMLHAFNADTGVEEFAYVPNELYADLKNLSDPNYTHKFYVDGSPTIVDAYIGSSWKTILVGSLRGGGQGLYALDVTDPDGFNSESSGKSKVLWEFTDNDANLSSATNSNFDADLGYTYGQPSIVRLHNGKWAAIFGNGYNNTEDNDSDGAANDSTTGNAVLYIVDVSDGQLIKKIDTGKGSSDDPTGNNYPNGLSEPAAVDIDGDSIVDYIYAGDLQGNMWKFDLTANSPGSWGIAYSNPLFTACAGSACGSSNYQSITSRPQVGRHPTSGVIVYFGTGKYIETSDNSSAGQIDQTFYAIWDQDLSTLTSFGRSSLLEQEIIAEVNQHDFALRATTDYQIDWALHKGWFIDLYDKGGSGTGNHGERQVSNSVLRNDRIIFTTLIPDDDPCEPGGDGWLMEMNATSGARLQYSPFDVSGATGNPDGKFTSDDYINVGDIDGDNNDDYMPASGKKSNVGIIPTPGIVTSEDGETEFKYESGSTGEIEITVENPGGGSYGRKSWRYLEN